MLILEENFRWHLEAFASELFICMYSPVLWTYTQRSVIRQVAFEHWIYKNHVWFKKGFNIASTTDGHIHFYLNYYCSFF